MYTTRLGPAGGLGGKPFGDYVIPVGTRLREIHIYANWCVDGLQLIFTYDKGRNSSLPRAGAGGGIHHVFFLGEDEYLLGISGRSGWYIDNIQFHTNKRSSHVYGGIGGEQDFYFQAQEGEEIVGIFGREGWYVDALGAIVRPRRESEAWGVEREEWKVSTPLVESGQSEMAANEAAEATTATRTTTLDVGLPPGGGREPLPKELQKVEGIGPRIAALLIDQGIFDLSDLAQTSVERLREILSAAGRRYNIADPTTWPEQAALAAQGAWDALKELQEKLKGGRRKMTG